MKFKLKIDKKQEKIELGISIGAFMIMIIAFMVILIKFPNKVDYLIKFISVCGHMLS